MAGKPRTAAQQAALKKAQAASAAKRRANAKSTGTQSKSRPGGSSLDKKIAAARTNPKKTLADHAAKREKARNPPRGASDETIKRRDARGANRKPAGLNKKGALGTQTWAYEEFFGKPPKKSKTKGQIAKKMRKHGFR